MADARFCPQCGVPTVPQAKFCAACGAAMPEPRPASTPSVTSSPPARTLVPGLLVLTFYLIAGLGLWLFVLRTQPFPSVSGGTEGQASKGGSTLPQSHPEVAIPADAKKFLADLATAANAAPQDLKTWKSLAEAQARASRIDSSYRSAALASYRHVLDLVPNDLDALRGLGNVYYDLEEFTSAMEYYQKYLTLKPDDANVRTDLGTMYLYSRNIDRAIAEYETVVSQKPEFFQAYFNLGIAHQEKGETAKARELLTRARTLTTDKTIQERIDQVLAQFNGGSALVGTSPPSTPTPASPSAAATLSPFQQIVERFFRAHEIMGPRISRIEWAAPTRARVLFQNFPMSAMPPEVRERFLGKLREQVNEAKKTNRISDAVMIELIDADTNQIMDTLSTATS